MLTQLKKTAPAAPTAVAIMGTDSAAEAANKPYKLGYMVWNASVPFYSNLIKKAQETAKEEGVTIDIQSGNGDLATQISVVQNFIAQGVDMILISPSDPKGIMPVIVGRRQPEFRSWRSTRRPTPAPARRLSPMSASTSSSARGRAKCCRRRSAAMARSGTSWASSEPRPTLDRNAGLDDTLKKYPEDRDHGRPGG